MPQPEDLQLGCPTIYCRGFAGEKKKKKKRRLATDISSGANLQKNRKQTKKTTRTGRRLRREGERKEGQRKKEKNLMF